MPLPSTNPDEPQVLIAVPCSSVPGLCIQARRSGRWVMVDGPPPAGGRPPPAGDGEVGPPPSQAAAATPRVAPAAYRREAAGGGRRGLAPLRHVVLFAGTALAEASAGRFRAAPHCVAKWPGAVRHSMVFELRAAAVRAGPAPKADSAAAASSADFAAAARSSAAASASPTADAGARAAGIASAGAETGPWEVVAVDAAAAAVGSSGAAQGDASDLKAEAAALGKRRRSVGAGTMPGLCALE